jgi:hypothetical protein
MGNNFTVFNHGCGVVNFTPLSLFFLPMILSIQLVSTLHEMENRKKYVPTLVIQTRFSSRPANELHTV